MITLHFSIFCKADIKISLYTKKKIFGKETLHKPLNFIENKIFRDPPFTFFHFFAKRNHKICR